MAEKEEKGVAKVSESFGKITREKSAEMAATTASTAARAEIESAYIMAVKRPRNEEDARVKILERCKNLRFADKAMYSKPVGKVQRGNKWVQNFAEGPSIRFAEEMLRLWCNIKTQQSALYDDPYRRIIKILVIDLESNSSYSKDVTIEKQVERKSSKDREVLGERTNTKGEKVFIVEATEQELMNKEAAEASKVIRNNGLRLIPDYIIEEATEIIRETVTKGIDKDPETAKRQITNAFAGIGVIPSELEKYVGPLKTLSPAQIADLRKLYTSIKDGQTTWAQIMEGVANGKGITAPQEKQPAKKSKKKKVEGEEEKEEEKEPNPLSNDLVKHFVQELGKCKAEEDLDKMIAELKPEVAKLPKANKEQLNKELTVIREKIQKKNKK